MSYVKVTAGVCGFETNIKAIPEKDYTFKLDIDTNCPNIKKIAENLESVDYLGEMRSPYGEKVKEAVQKSPGTCVGCVVPTAILKALQVKAGFSLPKEVKIEFLEE